MSAEENNPEGTTPLELEDAINKLGQSVLRVKAERDELLKMCKQTVEQLYALSDALRDAVNKLGTIVKKEQEPPPTSPR